MKQKLNKAGKMQNYDSKGRYAKNSPIEPAKPFISKKEKYLRRLQARDEVLINRAAKSNDPLLFEVAYSLIKEFPGKVTKINEYLIDKLTKKSFEQDIVMCRAIIEIKSGTAQKCEKQFLIQKRIAESLNKKHIVFAPNISFSRQKEYERCGIHIEKSLKNLVEYLKGLLK